DLHCAPPMEARSYATVTWPNAPQARQIVVTMLSRFRHSLNYFASLYPGLKLFRPDGLRLDCPQRVARCSHLRIPALALPALADFLLVNFRLESHHELAAELQHRPLDHRRLRQHQGQRLLLGDALLVGVRQLLEGGAGTVEQRRPAELVAPALQLLFGDAGSLVVVKVVGHAFAVEPGTRLLHGVAVLDPVD